MLLMLCTHCLISSNTFHLLSSSNLQGLVHAPQLSWRIAFLNCHGGLCATHAAERGQSAQRGDEACGQCVWWTAIPWSRVRAPNGSIILIPNPTDSCLALKRRRSQEREPPPRSKSLHKSSARRVADSEKLIDDPIKHRHKGSLTGAFLAALSLVEQSRYHPGNSPPRLLETLIR